jgi:TolB protein
MTILKTLQLLFLSTLLLPFFAYSAEGKIAYLANTNDYWQVWTMSTDGSKKKQITKSDYDKSHISWFPDGIEILVNGSQGQLTRVNTKTLEEKKIVLPIEGTVDAVVSPDGKYIAFSLSVADSIDNNHIWRVDINGNNLTKITNMEGLQHEPMWSPNGKWIYFLSGKGDQSHNIWRISLGDKTKEQITVGQLYNFDVTFSKQGDMAFSSNRGGNYDIWLQMDNALEQITDDRAIDSRPSLSQDGKYILFETLRSGVMNIWWKSLNTHEMKQLTHETIGARFPVWSH